MDDNNNVATEGNKGNNTDGKSFSQEDVNRIVGERLAKEKAKTTQELAEREKQLEQKELEFKAKSMLAEKGYSGELLEAIRCGSDEELTKSLEIIDRVLEQRGLSKADIEMDKTRPRFTAPLKGRKSQEDDSIRKAMNLR
ncbi:MAG: DUF4355 domain-containing protein [Clostridiales bacterium]|nr:DUF4355 domain-containing protein [Clostridiales bacterium]